MKTLTALIPAEFVKGFLAAEAWDADDGRDPNAPPKPTPTEFRDGSEEFRSGWCAYMES